MAKHLIAAASAAPAFHICTLDGQLGGVPQTLALARTLHTTLGAETKFADWIVRRIDQLGLVEGEDYLLLNSEKQHPSGTKTSTDYHLSIDAAKHIALAERNAAGREVRAYFIEVERRAREQAAPLLAQMQERLQSQEAQLAALRAKEAERALAASPRLQQALRYHAIAGLTHAEKARLMGWKTGDSWRVVLKELAALGLVDYQPNEGRSAAGQAQSHRLLAAHTQPPSAARSAALAANVQKARAAQAQKHAAQAD